MRDENLVFSGYGLGYFGLLSWSGAGREAGTYCAVSQSLKSQTVKLLNTMPIAQSLSLTKITLANASVSAQYCVHTAYVKAVDAGGNSAIDSRSFGLDARLKGGAA